MADFLRNSNKGRLLQDSVGFADPSLTKVTWLMQRELPAQFAAADSMELLANPGHNPNPEPRTPNPEPEPEPRAPNPDPSPLTPKRAPAPSA